MFSTHSIVLELGSGFNERIIISFELIYNMFFDLLLKLTLNERDLPFTKYLESNHETEGCEGQTFNLPEKYRWKK